MLFAGFYFDNLLELRKELPYIWEKFPVEINYSLHLQLPFNAFAAFITWFFSFFVNRGFFLRRIERPSVPLKKALGIFKLAFCLRDQHFFVCGNHYGF